jgi:hypothetical protein
MEICKKTTMVKVDIKKSSDGYPKARYTNAPLNPNVCDISFGNGANSPKGTTKPEKNRG